MAQGSYIFTNVSGHSTEVCVSNHLETECSYHLGRDYSQCLDSFHNGSTIKRLSLKRRPRVAENNMEKAQTGGSPSQWHSAESLSSPSSDAARLLGMSTAAKGRPPLPPPHGSPSDKHPSRNEGLEGTHTHSEFRPLPAARSLAPQRKSPTLEKTITETRQQLEQEVTSQLPPQPTPRRRLASFGGVSSAGSLSPFTGLGAYNQNNNGNKPTGFGDDGQSHLSPSLGSRGSTGCLRLSPQGSGRSTPVSMGSTHLQHVRDQMVVALQRLKELEEQVKIIPILQVKVSVLQEEKRQLVCQLKNQGDNNINNVILERTSSFEESDTHSENDCEKALETKHYRDCADFKEFRQLTEEMQALERTIKGGQLTAFQEKNDCSLQDKASKPLAAGRGKDGTLLSAKENKCVYTQQIETKSITTQVSEISLGIYMERDAEMDAQQLMINTLKERICHLEAELKESALQTEMSRLKLELQAAGARNRVDKASSARPSTASAATEARPQTTSQGIGNHTKFQDACTGDALEVKTVGVSCCRPELKSVSTGPDLPLGLWELRKRVETREVAVGVSISTNTQGVGVEIKVCDAESNTEAPIENLQSVKPIMSRSVACGDCSIDVIVCEPKEVVSQGMITDLVKGVELGVMAAPQTASQRTNTTSSSVSRFTNTKHAFNTDSSTNTVLKTQDKHTNTAQATTRTVSVGNGVRDMKPTTETRTIGVGTTNPEWTSPKPSMLNKTTRDTGVGFTNINENYLVGLKTRNMASGPSHLPDPVKTRSIGVGEGRIRDLSVAPGTSAQGLQRQPQSQWDPELNHYIEKMQRLLGEHGELLAEDFTHPGEGFAQQKCGQGCTTSNLSFSNKAAAQVVHPFQYLQPAAEREFSLPSQLPEDSSKSDRVNPEVRSDLDVKRMIQMLEQQSSSALQERSNKSGGLHRVAKKQNGDQGCSSTRKSMRLIKVTTGLDPVSYKPSATERDDSEEVERRGSRKLKKSSPDAAQTAEGKGGSHRGLKGLAKSHTKLRCRLSPKMYSACQALKMHLDDETVLPSRELHDCLQTLQQEWFSVSSHKSAAADTLEDYLSTFRVLSPSVLQHIANMSDGNGNTALHYSVSHSNFDIVKKLLDAEVCNVDQQNKAGYTPIMLAALAAVEAPEHMRVVEQLFMKGDVNAKASQAGQTALMLAVSHGRMDMVRALLARGAQVNLQDDEGSTALMCACEHGHADMVKLLLAQPHCDASLTDSDESTALSIALEAGHNDIAVLLYAHANFSKGQATAGAHHSGRTLSSSSGRGVVE